MSWLEVDINDHNYAATPEPVTDFITAKYTKNRVDVGSAQIVMPRYSAAGNRIMGAYGNHVPVTIRLVDEQGERDRFDGWVLDAVSSGPPRAKQITANIVDVQAVMRAVLAWSAPILPLEVQPGSYIYLGPAITGFLNIIQANAIDRLGMPMVVVRPAADASYLTNIAARFPNIEDLMKDTLPEMEQTLTVRVWQVGDPQPTGYTLTAPTIVVEFLPMNTPPAVVFEEMAGGVEAEVHVTAPKAGNAIVGGKSLDWLNKALSQTPLEAFFNSWGASLKNIFFAFQQFPVPEASGWGIFAPRETFVAGGASAWTLDAIQAGRQAMVDNAGRRQVKLKTVDGRPFVYGRDYRLGTRIGAVTEEDDTRTPAEVDAYAPVRDADVVWQQVTSVTVTQDRASGVVVETVIGDDRDPQDGFAKIIGRVKSLVAWFQAITTSP